MITGVKLTTVEKIDYLTFPEPLTDDEVISKLCETLGLLFPGNDETLENIVSLEGVQSIYNDWLHMLVEYLY